jgi:uncharacterized protein YbjT (DUF2867 family)
MNATNTKNKVIVVTDAAAEQGIVTAKCLLEDGWTVRALTSDLEQAAVKLLMKRGIEVVEVNPHDRTAVEQALADAYGVFYVCAPQDDDIEAEVRHGKLIADAAKAAGVQHFVYGSAGGVDRGTGVSQLLGKWQLEQYICSLDMPVTILRPAMLMESVASAGLSNLVMISALSSLVRPEKTIQLISVEDIAVFASLAFAQPEHYIGRTLELAGDAVTLSRIARIRRRVQGARLLSLQMPQFVIRRLPADVIALAEWLNREGYQADIASLRQTHPGLMTFEHWLNHRETKTQLKRYNPVPSYAARSV